jgi:predicted transposase YbfD/YdcC
MPTRKPVPASPLSLVASFAGLPDPRSPRNRRYPLINIVVIATCAVLAGADNWVAIEQWSKTKRAWLATFLDMSDGVPSHDTFGRVFSILSPVAFQEAFIDWARGFDVEVDGRVVAVDGKTSRRSHDRGKNRGPVHVVSAWCTSVGVSLGQRATDEKSNEITAVPELLDQLYLKGAIVTLDALGCQREIAGTIRRKEADYVLAVKGNQPALSETISAAFEEMLDLDTLPPEASVHWESESTHGREVERTAWLLPAPGTLVDQGLWPGIASILRIDSRRKVGDNETFEVRLYISSLPPKSASDLANAVREHWGVENGLHWVLDVAFREDDSRARSGHAAENLTRLRHIALNLLKRDRSVKIGVKTKRLRAGWDNDYLWSLLMLAGHREGEADA